jgi:hypothetical protein
MSFKENKIILNAGRMLPNSQETLLLLKKNYVKNSKK